MATYNTSQANQTLQFDSLSALSFDVVSGLSSNVAVSTVQAILPLPFDVRVYHVSVAYTGTLAGVVQIQIGTGSGNLSGATVGTADTNAPANTIMFATAPTITAAAGITQTFYPDVFDVNYQGSNASLAIAAPALTLRFVTNGSGAISGLTKITLGVKAINTHQNADYAPTPLGNYSFDPSVF